MTSLEKLASLPNASSFMRDGIALDSLLTEASKDDRWEGSRFQGSLTWMPEIGSNRFHRKTRCRPGHSDHERRPLLCRVFVRHSFAVRRFRRPLPGTRRHPPWNRSSPRER